MQQTPEKTAHHLLKGESLEPQRVFNFKSIPATVSFRLENEKFGEVYKLHPVLKVRI
jgi:hypothetical protein